MVAHLMGTSLASLLFQATTPNPGGLTPDQIHDIAMAALKRPAPAQGSLALLTPFALFLMIVAIVWLNVRQRQAQVRMRAELHKQLLDKFNSGREFSEFLESRGSQRFLEELWSQSKGPKDRILTAMRNGIVLAVLGLGMLALSLARRGFLVPAVLALALGVGFLISTAISYRFFRQWDQNQKANPENPPFS